MYFGLRIAVIEYNMYSRERCQSFFEMTVINISIFDSIKASGTRKYKEENHMPFFFFYLSSLHFHSINTQLIRRQ